MWNVLPLFGRWSYLAFVQLCLIFREMIAVYRTGKCLNRTDRMSHLLLTVMSLLNHEAEKQRTLQDPH